MTLLTGWESWTKISELNAGERKMAHSDPTPLHILETREI